MSSIDPAEPTESHDDEVQAEPTDVVSDAFGEGPEPGLPHDARLALATIMTQRFITRTKHAAAWDTLLAYEAEIAQRLDELFLELVIDRDHEVAFKRQIHGDGVPVLLRRDRALSRDASLLLIHLRQEHAYNDAIDESLVVSRDQVADFLNRFTDGRQLDQVALERRVDAAIRALELYNLLEPEPDDPDLLVVSPAVVPMVTPEVLAHLRDAYTEAARNAADPSASSGTGDDEPVTDEEEPAGE